MNQVARMLWVWRRLAHKEMVTTDLKLFKTSKLYKEVAVCVGKFPRFTGLTPKLKISE